MSAVTSLLEEYHTADSHCAFIFKCTYCINVLVTKMICFLFSVIGCGGEKSTIIASPGCCQILYYISNTVRSENPMVALYLLALFTLYSSSIGFV